MTKRNEHPEIGDIVEIVAGDDIGMRGTLDNVFVKDGVDTFTVVLSEDEFRYATEIKLIKRQ